MDKDREMVLSKIDEATSPERMSKQVAVEWLEELSADLDGRIEALREEMANEEE